MCCERGNKRGEEERQYVPRRFNNLGVIIRGCRRVVEDDVFLGWKGSVNGTHA